MPPRPDPHNVEWITVSDFTPGIYSKMRGYGATATPAPVGAAQETNTYRCIALPEGGLAPGPKKVADWTLAAGEASASDVSGSYRLGAMYAFGPARKSATATPSTYPDEIVYHTEWITSGTHATQPNKKRWQLRRARVYDTAYGTDAIQTVATSAQALPATILYWGSTMGSSRVAPTAAQYQQPGVPIVAFDYWSQGAASEAAVTMYPDPAAPTVLGHFNVTGIASKPGQLAFHQNRLILLYNQDWPYNNLIRRLNDVIFFTDPPNQTSVPPNSVIATTQVGTALTAETPTGFGAWGSLTTESFFLAKAKGGGVVVNGSLASPSVTHLPGVTSCGSNVSKAAATAHGLFYIGSDNGVWVWRGSDSSQKVSIQIDDGVFRMMTDMAGVNFHFEEWGDWIVCSNNWLYDVLTGGWWKIENPNPAGDATASPLVAPIWSWSRGFRGNHMYGGELSFTNSYLTPLHTWDREQSAVNYSWQSQPLHVSIDKIIDIAEVEILAQGTGTVAITFTGADGTSSATNTFTYGSNTQPVLYRQNVGKTNGGPFQNQFVTCRVVSDGVAGAAPMIYRISIAWRERTRI